MPDFSVRGRVTLLPAHNPALRLFIHCFLMSSMVQTIECMPRHLVILVSVCNSIEERQVLSLPCYIIQEQEALSFSFYII